MSGIHEAPVSQTVEWYTPPVVFSRLGLSFDLDPASPGEDVVPWVPARKHYTPAINGLLQPWDGLVWLNPPYGPQMAPFVERMVQHNNGVLLIAARTETVAFQRAAAAAKRVAFARDRLHFIRHDGLQARSSFASVFLAFGLEAAGAVYRADLGWTVENWL